ncbi:MAG: SBBP repeat-containing protein [Myxococcales bacterium]|nr:SBBP repeat-containing protein [Myxococcales bacterium]
MTVRSIRLWLLVLTPFLLLVSSAPRAAVFNVTKSADAPESLLPGAIMQIIDAMGDGYGNSLVQPWGIAVDASGNVYVTGAISQNAFKIGGPAILVPSLGPVGIAFLLTLLGATAYWRLRDSASVSYH